MATDLTPHPTAPGSSAGTRPQDDDPAGPLGARLRGELERAAAGLPDVDPARVLALTLRGLPPGTADTDAEGRLIEVAADLIVEDPDYSRLAARLLAARLERQTLAAGIAGFADAIRGRWGFRRSSGPATGESCSRRRSP